MNGSGVTYTPFAYDAKGNTTHDGYFSYLGDRLIPIVATP